MTTTKTVKMAVVTSGIDKAIDGLTSIADRKDDLSKGIELLVSLLGESDVQAKLAALSDQSKNMSDEGVELPVKVLGATEATAQLDELKDSAAEVSAELDGVKASSDEAAVSTDTVGAKAAESGGLFAGLGSKVAAVAVGLGAFGAISVKMAGNFDEMATQLVTGAGESEKNLNLVKQGMLSISAQTATSATEVASGMYLIESAGFHGAQGLDVLKAAAEGAKVGNADLASVANAVTSALNAYHLSGSHATQVTNELIATVASGKMHMSDLAMSIGNVLPVAAKADLSLAQVGGALATMTMQGMTARRASMNLANAIRALESPNAAAATEMQALGLNANTVSQNLGKVGLTGTLNELTEAILKNSKGGTVMASTFNAMSAPAKKLADEILQGKISSEGLITAEEALNPTQAALVAGFAKSATGATGLSQTFTGAMKAMMGGATGLQVALLLGGQSASTFAANVNHVQDAADKTSSAVTGFALIQKDFNFQLEQTKTSAEDTAISFGEALMPAVTAVLGPISKFASWLASSSAAAKSLAGVLITALVAVAFTKVVNGISSLSEALSKVIGLFGASAVAADTDAAATDVATGSMKAFTLSLLANPITLIIAAIVLLGVALFELTEHCKAFRDFWIDAWHDVEDATKDVFNWISGHWPLLLGILTGPIGLATVEIIQHWSDIEAWSKALWEVLDVGFDNSAHKIAASFDWLSNHLHQVWNTMLNFTRIAWSDMVNDITGVWSKIEGAVAKPMDWLSGEIWNPFAGVVDAVTKFLGMGSPIPHMSFSGGGHIPGYGGGDILPALLEPGETVVDKQRSRVLAPVFAAAGVPGYAAGGIIPGGGVLHDIGSAVSSAVGGAAHIVGDVVNFGKQLVLGGVEDIIKPFVDGLLNLLGSAPGASSGLGQMLTKLPRTVIDDFLNWVTGQDKKDASSNYGPVNVSGSLLQWILAGEKAAGVGSSWTSGLEEIIMHESSGNPSAINLTDINAQEGHPSQGLMQEIPSTFQAYHVAGTSTNIDDPVANIAAGIRYIESRYGGIGNVPGLRSLAAGGPYVGYAYGGIISEPIIGKGLTTGTNYSFGEAGRELVSPLGGFNGGGGTNINIVVNAGDAIDPNAVAMAIHEKLRRYRTKRGGQPLGLG